MKKILILGAGTAGTMMAVKLRRALDESQWQITLVDRDDRHIYQPGLLFIPFGIYTERDLYKPRSRFIPEGVTLTFGELDAIDPEHDLVHLKDGRRLPYDLLIVATGSRIVASETPGLVGEEWRRSVFDFYTPPGALALRESLRSWRGGRLVLNVVDMPIKCPVAPMEFLFLADWYFHTQGIRNDVELVYATPLSGPFTRQRCSDALSDILEAKNIEVEKQFAAASVDNDRKILTSYDGREIPFDMLVTIPMHRGSEAIARSGMGDELDFVPTDKHTLQALDRPNVFVIGDATNLPSSKAGSVAHFQADVLLDNVLRWIGGRELEPAFDGHANCFIETGFGKAVLIDFNYDVEPLPGRFPLPGAGPLTLLAESEANHWGKMAFRWAYWNLLLKGADMSAIGPRMPSAGKWS
ncbi:MAG: NAD(P)/FAD-dependent oxidoreductase [Gemmatimonadetes bacterium]|nr:NAD(P)/FAD-dependent oxidoreductase [Gemmatimonadota bacterium]